MAVPAQHASGTWQSWPSIGHGASMPGNGSGQATGSPELLDAVDDALDDDDALVDEALVEDTLDEVDAPPPPAPSPSSTTLPPHEASAAAPRRVRAGMRA